MSYVEMTPAHCVPGQPDKLIVTTNSTAQVQPAITEQERAILDAAKTYAKAHWDFVVSRTNAGDRDYNRDADKAFDLRLVLCNLILDTYKDDRNGG